MASPCLFGFTRNSCGAVGTRRAHALNNWGFRRTYPTDRLREGAEVGIDLSVGSGAGIAQVVSLATSRSFGGTMRLAPLFIVVLASALSAEAPPADHQIASSVQAAPEELRAGATVLGYDSTGSLGVLRKGSNDLHCLADNPNDDAFSVACYHKDLEPFMARGRELTQQGYKGEERHKIRWKDVDEGRVSMPREARMLYVLTGEGYDALLDEISKPYLRWVIYTPYATPESSGISATPGDAPWLMFPGTAGAHVMINPPKH